MTPGLLYITEVADESSTSLVPITWDIASITSENWVMNGTFANGTEAGSLYILDADNKYIGVANTTTATATATTSTSAAASTSSSAPEHLVTGFALFATQLVYNNNTSLEAQFWACPTDDDDVHAIVWIPDGESATSGSFPLVIKASED